MEDSQVGAVIRAIANDYLPPRMALYEVDGKCLFQIRGPSGGVVGSYIYYIILNDPPKDLIEKTIESNKRYYYGVEFSNSKLSLLDLTKLFKNSLDLFYKALDENKARVVDLDGGDFGRGDN